MHTYMYRMLDMASLCAWRCFLLASYGSAWPFPRADACASLPVSLSVTLYTVMGAVLHSYGSGSMNDGQFALHVATGHGAESKDRPRLAHPSYNHSAHLGSFDFGSLARSREIG
jgi:hypothetical protein